MKTIFVPFCLALAVGFTFGFQGHRLPRFGDYPVKDVFTGKPAKLRLAHNPEARMFRTMLREGVKGGANFAGHYAYVTWGCGTECQRVAIVDVETGEVFMYPGLDMTAYGALYTINSRLLITDPIDSAMMAEHYDQLPNWMTRYYVWDGTRLIQIDSTQSATGPDSTL